MEMNQIMANARELIKGWFKIRYLIYSTFSILENSLSPVKNFILCLHEHEYPRASIRDSFFPVLLADFLNSEASK